MEIYIHQVTNFLEKTEAWVLDPKQNADDIHFCMQCQARKAINFDNFKVRFIIISLLYVSG